MESGTNTPDSHSKVITGIEFQDFLYENQFSKDEKEGENIPVAAQIKTIEEGCGKKYCFSNFILREKQEGEIHIFYINAKQQLMHCIVKRKYYESFIKANGLN